MCDLRVVPSLPYRAELGGILSEGYFVSCHQRGVGRSRNSIGFFQELDSGTYQGDGEGTCTPNIHNMTFLISLSKCH